MAKSIRASLIWLTLFAIPALLLLLWLGTWQIQRLAWKEALLDDLAAKQQAAPVDITDLDARAGRGDNIDYLPVTFTATMLGKPDLHLYWVHEGKVGWRLIVPLELADGAIILLDRGFMTDHRLNSLNPATGPVNITGRALRPQPPGLFTPDNEPAKNIWYWRDLPAMANALGLAASDLKPYLVLLELEHANAAWPMALATPPRIENRHLGYALTWYGLAACLVGVYAAYVMSVLRSSKREP